MSLPLQNLRLIPSEDRYLGQVSVFVAREEAGGRMPPARRSVVPIRVTGEEYLNAFENPFRYGFKLVLTPGTRRLAPGHPGRGRRRLLDPLPRAGARDRRPVGATGIS